MIYMVFFTFSLINKDGLIMKKNFIKIDGKRLFTHVVEGWSSNYSAKRPCGMGRKLQVLKS